MNIHPWLHRVSCHIVPSLQCVLSAGMNFERTRKKCCMSFNVNLHYLVEFPILLFWVQHHIYSLLYRLYKSDGFCDGQITFGFYQHKKINIKISFNEMNIWLLAGVWSMQCAAVLTVVKPFYHFSNLLKLATSWSPPVPIDTWLHFYRNIWILHPHLLRFNFRIWCGIFEQKNTYLTDPVWPGLFYK